MNRIEKDIDALGRVVIPIEFRRRLGVESNAKVFVSLENDVIIISTVNTYCALCGIRIEKERKFRLCDRCTLKIKAE